MGRYEEAIRCYDKTLELEPRIVITWYNKAVSEDKLGHAKQAAACYQMFLAKAPAQDAQKIESARQRLRELSGKGQSSGNWLKTLAAKVSKPNPKKAREEAQVWYNKGNFFLFQGIYQDAITCYDNALGIDPSFSDPWNSKGACLKLLGRHEEALIYYDKALELNPAYGTAWNNKGESLMQLGRYEEALSCFDKALVNYSKAIMIWFSKGTGRRKAWPHTGSDSVLPAIPGNCAERQPA